MKLEKGNLSISLFDIACVVFLPITLLVLPSYFLGHRRKRADKIARPWWTFAQNAYWVVLVAAAGFFTVQTLTFNRTIVSVDEQRHTEIVSHDFAGDSEREVLDYVLLEIEETPKFGNIEQLWNSVSPKTYHFCRSATAEWFAVSEDGSLTLLVAQQNSMALPVWEIARNRYLEQLYDEYRQKLERAEYDRERDAEHEQLEEQIRTRFIK